MESQYNPKEVEEKIYQIWEESGFFNPDKLPGKRPERFTIIMPPTNANGRLHVGHALTITIEDIMIRFQRMRGKLTLWVPGADHAGFETQVVYEKKLEKEGRSRFKMKPQELYDEIMKFTLENKIYMENDTRKLGASCDWSREKFTLDQSVISETQETFRKLYRDDLIYRDYKTVNWCTKHQTSLSDLETISIEKKDKLYFIKYGPLTVATVRPETIFGDVAIAVNPKDPRYQKFIGQIIEIQHLEKKFSLIILGDNDVDMAFGSGALKITPAHDHNDYNMSVKHKLKRIVVIDQFGKLNEKTGKYAGMKVNEVRQKVIEDLQTLNLIEKIEDYTHAVPVCYKCKTTIEPRLMPQWFVKMQPLATMAAEIVRAGKIQFIPNNFKKIFLYWMDNTIDWNISRQIVWGISIPAFICKNCNRGILDSDNKRNEPCVCGGAFVQDTDTLDTWFSSGQWPLLALGYPHTANMDFYPTDVMESGSDLIFRWIPRMVFLGLYLKKEIPFRTIYLHGMVNDQQGEKMSKSKGNVISPIDLVKKYGADALRISLVIGNTPGTDLSLNENKIKGYKHFCNKIWNATRFVLTNIEGVDLDTRKPVLTVRDEEILKELKKVVENVTDNIENFRFHLAGEELYHYFWHNFADIIIEEMKPRLTQDNNNSKQAAQWILLEVLITIIKMLHPFIPFITEEIWSRLPIKNRKLLMIEEWPKIENKI
ncbi:valine--tRNA ligase [Candidatus Azambacteria bacterium]|nr:valine--tRNA ligase [Candidatus Azambacteria bacterium]